MGLGKEWGGGRGEGGGRRGEKGGCRVRRGSGQVLTATSNEGNILIQTGMESCLNSQSFCMFLFVRYSCPLCSLSHILLDLKKHIGRY